MANFSAEGIEKYVALSTAPADPAAITAAELGAGFDMIGTPGDEVLKDVSGFELSSSVRDTPNMGSLKSGSVRGPQTIGLLSFMYNRGTASSAIFDEFSPDDEVWIVKHYGDTTGEPYEVVNATAMDKVTSSGAGLVEFTIPFAGHNHNEGVFAA